VWFVLFVVHIFNVERSIHRAGFNHEWTRMGVQLVLPQKGAEGSKVIRRGSLSGPMPKRGNIGLKVRNYTFMGSMFPSGGFIFNHGWTRMDTNEHQ
jgi:hypothetical protein